MNINLVRRIDYYMGPIICRFLLFLRSFSGPAAPFTSPPPAKDCRNILIIKFFGMGTILLVSPALRELKAKFKSAKIIMLTLSSNRELCEMLPPIDEIVSLRMRSLFGFLISFIRAVSDIRKRKIDVVIDLEFLTNFSALVTLLVILFRRPRMTVGFNSPAGWRNEIHDVNVSFDHSRHITKIFAKMVHSITGEAFEPSFQPERASLMEKMDSEYMDQLMRSKDELARCGFFLCVNINAGDLCLHRRWPKEYFINVINELIRRPDVAILLIGAARDAEYVSEFRKSLSASARIIDVSGRTNIRELVGLFTKCNLLITNDSGPFHLAEIIGLSTISFFGPETPYLYGPLSKRHHVFYEDLYCSPCLNIYNSKMSHCKNNMCLKGIMPERVLKVIEDNYLNE